MEHNKAEGDEIRDVVGMRKLNRMVGNYKGEGSFFLSFCFTGVDCKK